MATDCGDPKTSTLAEGIREKLEANPLVPDSETLEAVTRHLCSVFDGMIDAFVDELYEDRWPGGLYRNARKGE